MPWRRRTLALLTVLAGLAAPGWAQVPDDGGHRYSGEPVTMSLRDADLVETLRTFARLGDFNLLLHPGVRGTVTVELKEVPWDQALETILKVHGLGMHVTDGTVRVAPTPVLRSMLEEEARHPAPPILRPTRLEGTLEHADARRVARLLTSSSEPRYLGAGGTARAVTGTNILVVEDLPDRLRAVSRLLAALDVEGAEAEGWKGLVARARDLWRRQGFADRRP